MLKFSFDYKAFVKLVKLIKKTSINKLSTYPANSSLIIARESEISYYLRNGDFSQFKCRN